MTKQFLLFFFILVTLNTYSQKLIYKSNGNIFNEQDEEIAPNDVRILLKNNQNLLTEYEKGRNKKTAGNVLLYGGLGFVIGDLINGATNDVVYPTALTIVGLTAIIIAIPVKIGFSKKIKKVANDYNTEKQVGNNESDLKKIEFITNSNGAGLRLTFN